MGRTMRQLFRRIKEFGYLTAGNKIVVFCDVQGSKLPLSYGPILEELATNRGHEINLDEFFSMHGVDSQLRGYIESTLCESSPILNPSITELVGHDSSNAPELESAISDLDRIVTINRNSTEASREANVRMHIIHSRKVEVDRFEEIENSLSENDLVFTSTFIDKFHIIFGPRIRRQNTPGFRCYFENWVIHENASLNDTKPWSQIMAYFDTRVSMALGCVEITKSTEGLVAFNLVRTLRKYVENNKGAFHWEEAFGVTYCDLVSGLVSHDSVIHGVS